MKKFSLLLLAIAVTAMAQAQIKIIGHRGASYLAPENTVASAKLAWEVGADAVETDIYLSKDNKIIVSHDANTKRTSGQDYKIKETSSKILRKLDVGSFKNEKYKGEKIPYLDEIVRTTPAGKEMVVEIKCGNEILPYLEKVVKKYEKSVVFTFICFDFQTITDTKKAFPKSKCYWLCGNTEVLNKTINKVPEAGLEGISLSYNIVNEEVMQQAKNLSIEVCTWTVDDPAEAKRLISLGVKVITTNRPGWLKEQIL
ncbi:MAG TPA: glycerophosphodiester phosphodiesterase family protein [Bacteroidales bacterium]|nr:glycerophosphodiester phosphodiesterase family protein [Bacteroidales bacterium]